ncbi:MAG: phospholipase D family protein [Terriglobales bacterium]
MIAVAYVGKGAARMLRVQEGDVLVCALTLANCRNGSVCPEELLKLKRRGVRIHALDDLHAKVYLLGDRVIVGSANASLSGLDEAALLSTDAKVLRRARAWFKDRTHSPVGDEWLGKCSSVYRPPRFGRRGSARNPELARVWVIGTEDTPEFPSDERRLCREAKRKAKPRRGFEASTLRWPGDDRFQKLVSPGDRVVADWNGVHPPARVLAVKRGHSGRGGSVAYVVLEMAVRPRILTWAKFRQACKRGGIRFGEFSGARELKRDKDIRFVSGLLRQDA